MGNMRYCPQCGHALEPTAKFCENCGAAVSKTPDGQKNETGQVFTPRRSSETSGRGAGTPPQRRLQAGQPAGGYTEAAQPGAGYPQRRPQSRTPAGGYTGSVQAGAANPQRRRPQTGASADVHTGSVQTGTGNPQRRRPQTGTSAGPSIPNIGRDHAFSPQRPDGTSPEEWRRTRAQRYVPTDPENRWDLEVDEDEEEGRFTTLQYILLGFIGVLVIALLTFGAFWLIGRSKNHSSNGTTANQAQTEQTDAKGSEKKETEAIKILGDDGNSNAQAQTGSTAQSETAAQAETTAQTDATATTLNYTDFTVTLPADWKGKYGITQQGNFYVFYQQSSKALGYNGTLFTIGKYTDMSYQDLPNYRLLGTGGGAAYVLTLPTDVQYAQNNEAAQKEYTAMASEIDQIASGIQILVTGDGPKQTEAIQIQGQTQAQADDSEYILPESSERALTDADVQGMSYDDLQMAINEIYARHGRIFGTESIQQYFEGKSWYQGTTDADHFSDSVFSSVENQNIQFLLKKMGLE